MSNVDMIRELYDAFGRGDVPVVLGALHADCEWYEAEGNPYAANGALLRGPDEVLQGVFMKLGSEWDGFTVFPKEFHDAGDTVIVEARYGGTYKTTGTSIDAQACHVWRVQNGTITGFQQYVDTAQMQDAMGAR